MITLDDVKAAAGRIAGIANRTPVMTSRTLDALVGCRVFLKCENFQRAGAFKFRGALNAVTLLCEEEKRRGVVTHSSGNHAQALALAAGRAGVKAVIVMPEGSPAVKKAAVLGYGAEVVSCANSLAARESACNDLIAGRGLSLVHPYNDERVMAGAGTAAHELLEEAGPLDLVLAPVGGGGLLGGTAVATRGVNPRTVVMGVEPAGADDAFRSLEAGHIIPQTDPRTIADGLRTSLGSLTFPLIRELTARIERVGEREIIEAMRFLWERMKLVVEPSGATALAPLLTGRFGKKYKRVGVIISGGNLDLAGFFDQLSGKIDTP